MKELVEKLLRFINNLRYIFVSIPSSHMHRNVQYYSQWESPERVDKFLSKELSAKDDPKWKHSGAKTKEEYELWSWNICGMACLKMVLKRVYFKEFQLLVLAKKCEQFGGYIEKQSSIDGLFYQPMVPFLRQEFGLECKIKRVLVIGEIMHATAKGSYVIVSVDPAVRDPKSSSQQTGGHLVLITGYDKKKKLFYLHNPSGYYKKSQKYAEISLNDFKKFFAYKGFVISK